MKTPFPIPEHKVLFESVPGLYLALLPNDPVFTIVAASDAYLAATMTERDQILGCGVFEIFPDNPDNAEATGVSNLRASLRNAIRTRAADTMAVQKYDIRRPDSEGGGFEERFWSPVNTPVLDSGQSVVWIIHRVEDVTEFIRLKEKEAEQAQFTERLLVHSEQMESEVFLRAQEVQAANRRLHSANEELARLREEDSLLARIALERSERRYRTLVSAGASIVWTRNPKGFLKNHSPGAPLPGRLRNNITAGDGSMPSMLRTATVCARTGRAAFAPLNLVRSKRASGRPPTSPVPFRRTRRPG